MADFDINKNIVGPATLFGTFELVKLWRDSAPTLAEVRKSPQGLDMRQRLMDTNYMSVGLILTIGGSFAYFTKSWAPIAIPLVTVATLSYWHYCVLNSSNEMM